MVIDDDDMERVRADAAATIARVNATLAAPRPEGGATWALPERAVPQPAPKPARQPIARRAAPEPGITRPMLDARLDAMEAAIAKIIRAERMATLRRLVESERRLRLIEARLGIREGEVDGD